MKGVLILHAAYGSTVWQMVYNFFKINQINEEMKNVCVYYSIKLAYFHWNQQKQEKNVSRTPADFMNTSMQIS